MNASASNSSRQRISIVGAAFGTGNLGVSALATGTVSAVLHTYPDAEVVLIDYAREPSSRKIRTLNGDVAVPTINIRFSKKIHLENNIVVLLFMALIYRLIPSKRLASQFIAKNRTLMEIHKSSMVLSLAGGDSFSDIYGMGRLIYVVLPQLLAILLRLPLVLLPQTLGPFKRRSARMLARGIMNRSTLVYSRDHHSIESAKRDLGVRPQKLLFGYDMAFAMEPVSPETPETARLLADRKGKTLVGLNISGLLMMGGYTGGNMFGLACDYGDLMRTILADLVADNDVMVVLFPHVLGTDPESDTTAGERFYQKLDPQTRSKVRCIKESYDQQETKFLIGQCDFFVGARMHACIAAISQAVPAVCLAYSRKFIGVLDAIKFPELVVDLRSKGTEGLTTDVLKLFRMRSDLRLRLEREIPGVRNSVLNMFADTGGIRRHLHEGVERERDFRPSQSHGSAKNLR